jgi:mRNA-degrading endonuclease RelE of RelBE toxin-antitoxin system
MPPLGVELTPRFRAGARALPAERRQQLAQAVAMLAGTFGQPHLHSGLGIRRLKGAYFECRVGRDTRIVFKLEAGTATLVLVGNHEDVRRFIKG